MNPEQSRRVDAALDQLRSLQRPNPHQPVLLDTLGSTARVAHLEETAATTEIRPPDASGAWPQNLSRPQSALPDLTRAHFR